MNSASGPLSTREHAATFEPVTRVLALFSALLMLLTACAGTEDASSQAGVGTVDDAAAATDEDPTAPDFELELGDGGTFRLSDETKPVFLVFWAEW